MGAQEVPTEKLAEKARAADTSDKQQYVLMDLVDAIRHLRRRVEELENEREEVRR